MQIPYYCELPQADTISAAERFDFAAAELLSGSGEPEIASVPHCGDGSPTCARARFLYSETDGADEVLHIQCTIDVRFAQHALNTYR